MGKCLYPDCDGEVEPDAAFCDECGRSQAGAQVAAARAGAQARSGAVPVVAAVRPLVAGARPLLRPAPAREVSIPLALAFGLVFLLLFLGCVGALAIQLALSPLIPLPATRPTPTGAPGGALPGRVVAYGGLGAVASGSWTVTVVPMPSVLSSPTVPPCAVTISRTIASPSPPTLVGPAGGAGASPAGPLPW